MGFSGKFALGKVFWGILGEATRNLLLKMLPFRVLGGDVFLGVLCVATGNLLLKRLSKAIWVLGDFWGLGGGYFWVFRGNLALGRDIWGYLWPLAGFSIIRLISFRVCNF